MVATVCATKINTHDGSYNHQGQLLTDEVTKVALKDKKGKSALADNT